MRNTEAGILLQPIGRAQVILRRRELRVQIEGPLEALYALFAVAQDCLPSPPKAVGFQPSSVLPSKRSFQAGASAFSFLSFGGATFCWAAAAPERSKPAPST